MNTNVVLSFVFLCIIKWVLCTDTLQTYLQSRAELVEEEVNCSLAALVTLNGKEIVANNILSILQEKETIIMGDNFPPALNFFQARGWILNSSIVFPLIKQMPKGAALHQHLTSSGDFEYLVYNTSYKYPCFAYYGDGMGQYQVGAIDCFNTSYLPSDGPWIPLSALRAKNPNFDSELVANLTMATKDFGDYYQLWAKFDFIFSMLPMLSCKEVMADFLARLFFIFQRDNIQHADFRAGPFIMHDLQNRNYTFDYFIEMFEEIATTANFSSKIIYAVSRHVPQDVMLDYMLDAHQLSQQYPNTVIGFDMDGPEDEGYPLLYYIEQFLQVINSTNNGLRFYFHAGETIYTNNTNLYDAILLNTTRIGHGLQLYRHPILIDDVKSRDICVEVCPISNQVLEFVQDLRSHPALEFFNRGMPIVISSDDPGIYGYEGTSYDFYEVYMAWNLNISGLKQLALNSIQYSTWLNAEQQQQVLKQFQQAWGSWIDAIVTSFN